MSETPKVQILGPITPTVDSERAGQLHYEGLSPAVAKYAPGEHDRQSTFWNSENDSLEEEQAARQLALQYMLMGAERLNETVTAASKQLWSERYTQAASEIYGAPDADTAVKLIGEQATHLMRRAINSGIDEGLTGHFKHLCETFGVTLPEYEEVDTNLVEAAKQLGDYLEEKYASVYAALDLENAPAHIAPADLADRFEAALEVLAAEHDPAWFEWKIERKADRDKLSINAGDKRILVGLNRADVTPTQLKSLFSHEVLLHAQRCLNGSKVSKQLSTGLPGYLGAEEGLGVFFEYGVTGNVPEKNIDRYVDIALALGQVDGQKHTRAELVDFALARARLRNELLPAEERQTEENIQKAVYAHVNRIYRGTLGDDFVGVFTKDIAYHKGFLDMGSYVAQQLKAGKSIAEVVDFLLLGKFDPTNHKHLAYLEQP